VAKEQALWITVDEKGVMLQNQGPDAMSKRLTAWQCIGCGRIEAPQPCIGICQDCKIDLVYASEHDKVLAQLEFTRWQAGALAALVRQLAHATPRKGEWERSYRAVQARARRTLELLAIKEESRTV